MFEKTLDAMLAPVRDWQHAPPGPRQLREAAAVLREKAGRTFPALNSTRIFETSLRRLLKQGASALRPRDDMVLASNFSASSDLLDGARLVETSAPCTELLARWQHRTSDRLLGPLLWRSVFIAYFLLDDTAEHKQLRTFLLQTLPTLPRDGMQPGWLVVAERHRRVFGSDPLDVYAEEWLHGKTAVLDELQEQVDIPGGSWFWVAFVDAIARRVERMNDATFAQQVARLIELPDRFPMQRDRILAVLVERAARNQAPLDAGLLEKVISHWGNPQLDLSDRSFRWSQVSAEARLWVCQCLAEQDLADFFELIKRSSAQLSAMDQRRFTYWKRFTGSMQFTKLILGSGFRTTSNRDIVKFIEKRRQRLGWLKNSNPENIAIVMKLGGYWFVEFAETGNACYGYEEVDRPFDVNSRELSLLQLKNKTVAKKWLPHSGPWEQEFDRTLSKLGIWPNGVQRGRQPASARAATGTSGSSALHPAFPPLATAMRDELAALAQAVVDNRSKGGSLWIETSGSPSAKLLEAMKITGYRFAAGRGFYR